MTRVVILACLLLNCAVGVSQQEEVYGYKTPEEYDGGSPNPAFTDPNANDPYYSGCFWQQVSEYDSSVQYFYVCDGVPFSVNDEVDPGPESSKR
jgi:hypothetical protein